MMGGYDCNWTLKVGDSDPCGIYMGCVIDKTIYLERLGLKDMFGGGLLWHEIKHVMCSCNWHGSH